jgi:hypothetical protein
MLEGELIGRCQLLAFIDWGSWWLGPEWVYVDETKIKARDRTYYLWLAVDESSLQWNGYMRLWNV